MVTFPVQMVKNRYSQNRLAKKKNLCLPPSLLCVFMLCEKNATKLSKPYVLKQLLTHRPYYKLPS